MSNVRVHDIDLEKDQSRFRREYFDEEQNSIGKIECCLDICCYNA